MPPALSSSAPEDVALVDALRDDLVAARFRVDVIDALWGPSAAAALHRGQREPAVRAISRARASGAPVSPVSTLARLFLLGSTVPADEVADALPTLGVAGLEALGFIGPAGTAGGVRARLDLRPYSFVDSLGAGSWWIASDLGESVLGRPLDPDHVLGIGGASMTLSGLMIPTPVDSVLDLGTGCGIQALHAARHARRVVATDISRRALAIAAFNARLNGIDSIEFRHGSLFEPVAGERFDRIVSNPPFVITPRQEGVPLYEYRDGGLVGDALVASVIRSAPSHLAPGGIAQLLGNWEYGASDGLHRVRSWVASSPVVVDAWVIERDRQDAPLYAETWIRDGGTRPGTPAFDSLYSSWLDDFEARGVREVGFGYVLLRRPAAAPAVGSRVPAAAPTLDRYERVDAAIGSNPIGLGDHLAVCLAGHDWQAHRDDDELLAGTYVYASDVTEERHYWPGHDDPVVMTLRQGGGFSRSIDLDTGLAAFVGACDGDLSASAIAAAIAQVLSVDEAALRAALAPRLRALLADVFLLPAP
ncbi:methyltransferase [Herbiconiux sp. VKM Ac-1786]|nr:methyltransferase [Herbiconiux sp. VKM Ac-1786]MBF4571135.1 methyltransferase [Herbiconiux sp. VKM Ac-1786]